MSKVLIAGGGICGLATALIAKRLGVEYDFHIFEAGERDFSGGGCVILAPNAMRVLDAAGVSVRVLEAGNALHSTEFFDMRGDHIVSREVGNRSLYGFDTVLIRRSALIEILRDAVIEENIQLTFSRKVDEVVPLGTGVGVKFSNGIETDGDFILGTDGIHSKVRDFIIGRNIAPTYSGFVYLAGFSDHPDPKSGMEKALSVAFGDVGFFGWARHLSKKDGRSVYWYCYIKESEEIGREEMKVRGSQWIADRVKAVHAGWGFPINELVDNTSEFCATNIYDLDSLDRWSNQSAVILGDAAHALNPIAGQGAATALEDAEALVRCMIRHRGDFNMALAAFEHLRKQEVSKIRKGSRRSNRMLGDSKIGSFRRARNVVYKLVNTIVPARVVNRRYFYSVEKAESEYNKKRSGK